MTDQELKEIRERCEKATEGGEMRPLVMVNIEEHLDREKMRVVSTWVESRVSTLEMLNGLNRDGSPLKESYNFKTYEDFMEMRPSRGWRAPRREAR